MDHCNSTDETTLQWVIMKFHSGFNYGMKTIASSSAMALPKDSDPLVGDSDTKSHLDSLPRNRVMVNHKIVRQNCRRSISYCMHCLDIEIRSSSTYVNHSVEIIDAHKV
jgi:hypothetical protein